VQFPQSDDIETNEDDGGVAATSGGGMCTNGKDLYKRFEDLIEKICYNNLNINNRKFI
jgi:hypothetical protein